jgi:hypothetical protein
MMAITTSSSIRVNAQRPGREEERITWNLLTGTRGVPPRHADEE